VVRLELGLVVSRASLIEDAISVSGVCLFSLTVGCGVYPYEECCLFSWPFSCGHLPGFLFLGCGSMPLGVAGPL